MIPIIQSMLDDDLYKLTQCQAVCEKYPRADAKYSFINRGQHKFSMEMIRHLADEIYALQNIRLSGDEAEWLRYTCPFFTPVFIDFLKGYRYDADEVKISTMDEKLKVTIEGPWYRTILWEVKLMAMISELHFAYLDDDCDLAEAFNIAADKATRMAEDGIKFADFGTRRRYSKSHHHEVVGELASNGKDSFVGTSNMALAREYDIKPIGTQAHEWFMFHGAKHGYKDANTMALRKWVSVYRGNLGIALSDTFTTKDFFRAFGTEHAKLFDGCRHDSGDPFGFTDDVVGHYESLGIDPMTKTIVFSDGLDVARVLEIYNYCADRIGCSFGIGTNLTNDIEGITPLNMVIKMTDCRPNGLGAWLPVIKLSDSPGKHTGDPEEIKLCKRTLQIQ